MTQSDSFGNDPYNYADVDIYSFDVNLDLTRGRFNVSEPKPVDQDYVEPLSATYPAAHPHLEGMDEGKTYVVATPYEIFGPYATHAAAQSLLDDGTVNPDESMVAELRYP